MKTQSLAVVPLLMVVLAWSSQAAAQNAAIAQTPFQMANWSDANTQFASMQAELASLRSAVYGEEFNEGGVCDTGACCSCVSDCCCHGCVLILSTGESFRACASCCIGGRSKLGTNHVHVSDVYAKHSTY